MLDTNVILDSSSLLCLINQETGQDVVRSILDRAIMSSVNIAEVVGVLTRYGVPKESITSMIAQLVRDVVVFDEQQAYKAGYLEQINREQKLGLSLGDRACIALSQTLALPIYTTDKAWLALEYDMVHVIR